MYALLQLCGDTGQQLQGKRNLTNQSQQDVQHCLTSAAHPIMQSSKHQNSRDYASPVNEAEQDTGAHASPWLSLNYFQGCAQERLSEVSSSTCSENYHSRGCAKCVVLLIGSGRIE
jgi:hypothetical protein